MPSRVSLATGVTASENSTYANTPSLPSTLDILPQLELPVPPNYFTLRLRVPTENQIALTSTGPTQLQRPSPIAADLSVDQLLAQIQSGIDLDQVAFTEGNITYWHLQNIDRNANTQFYTESSSVVDDNYEPPCHEDSETMGEEEEEEEISLPIPGPSHLSPIHLTTQELEHCSNEQLSENKNYKLDRHLGTIIEERF